MLDRFGNLIYRPKKLDPKEILRQGKARLEEENKGAISYTDPAYLHFDHGGAWDGQRLKGYFQREFLDATTVLIGIYCCGKGLPESECLDITNLFAWAKGTYPSTTRMHPVYKSLPVRNVINTHIGYELVRSGRIKPYPPRPASVNKTSGAVGSMAGRA